MDFLSDALKEVRLVSAFNVIVYFDRECLTTELDFRHQPMVWFAHSQKWLSGAESPIHFVWQWVRMYQSRFSWVGVPGADYIALHSTWEANSKCLRWTSEPNCKKWVVPIEYLWGRRTRSIIGISISMNLGQWATILFDRWGSSSTTTASDRLYIFFWGEKNKGLQTALAKFY